MGGLACELILTHNQEMIKGVLPCGIKPKGVSDLVEFNLFGIRNHILFDLAPISHLDVEARFGLLGLHHTDS